MPASSTHVQNPPSSKDSEKTSVPFLQAPHRLANYGSNYPRWLEAVNTTLCYILKSDAPIIDSPSFLVGLLGSKNHTITCYLAASLHPYDVATIGVDPLSRNAFRQRFSPGNSFQKPTIIWEFSNTITAFVIDSLKSNTKNDVWLFNLDLSAAAPPSNPCNSFLPVIQEGAGWLFWVPGLQHFVSLASTIFPHYQAGQPSPRSKKGNLRHIINTLRLGLVNMDVIYGSYNEVSHSILPVTFLKLPNSFAAAMCTADMCLSELQKRKD
ncbi:hypothetical protein O181_011496 [Austropuccinia psidii MF-1]|uniref:Uncharacterized protein n=1 Tax=Austropuccinia psidii MF-1 TaxID=1389203 RepID=A0A9Q3BSX2_9BASI|nr:hypothetical protein [Austropuccinia psidii MF-1]